MQRIRREDYLRKCKKRDDFVYTHVRDILSHQPFDEILEYQNGDVYLGTTKNRKRHGYGYYIYKEIRSVYQGEWIENAKSGYGTLYNRQGIVYSGEWLNNISHGFGCTYTNERLFLGTYKFGLMNGVGILKKNSSYNFCLFESNRKKCKIKITKYMDIYLHYYKKDRLFLKENLSAFFPVYADSTISRLVRKQIFDHLFAVDISFWRFFTKGDGNAARNVTRNADRNAGEGSPSGGFLSYVNYESRMNFLKGLIRKGAEGGIGNEGQPDRSVCSTEDSVWNSFHKGETNQRRNGSSLFPFHEDMDPRGDFLSSEAAKGSRRRRTSNEERCPLFVKDSLGGANCFYNSDDFLECTPHLKLTHLLYKSDSESGSEFCPDVTPSTASSPERHFKVKKRISAPIRSVLHSNIGASEKSIEKQKRQGKGRRLKLYKLLARGCSKLGCGGSKGEGAQSNDPSESTAECRDVPWERGYSTQCGSRKAALDRNTLRGEDVAGPKKGMGRMQRQMRMQRQIHMQRQLTRKTPLTGQTPLTRQIPLTEQIPPTLRRLLSYLKYKNEKNQIECIYQWRSYHLFVLLHLFGLQKYIATFKCNHMNGFHFFTLNRKILRMLGVDKHEHIYFLLNFVNAFSSLHNTYLKMLLPWGNIRGDSLVTFSSIPKSELFLLSRLGRHGSGKASYLCYYADAPVRLKMFSGKEWKACRSGTGASGEERDDIRDGDSSPVREDESGASPCDDGTIEGALTHLGNNPLLIAPHKFLFDERQLNIIGESILEHWGRIKGNLVGLKKLESPEMSKRLRRGDLLHPRAQVEGKKQKEKIENEGAQDEAATLMERIQRRTEFMKEHFVLSNLRHPNVIKYIGNVISRKKEKFGLVFEFLSGMCLHDAIYTVRDAPQGQRQTCGAEGPRGESSKGLTDGNIIRLFYEIAAALFYLHSKRVVHGNISSKNIFVSEDGGGIKLCNFEKASIESYYDYKVNASSGGSPFDESDDPWYRRGNSEKRNRQAGDISTRQGRSKATRRNNNLEGEKMNLPLPYITSINEVKNINTMMTSPLLLFQGKKFDRRNVRCSDPYAAPEILREEECTDKCDIYAFGVVMYEVLFGGLPFMSDYMPSFFWMATCFHQKYIYIDVDKLHGKFPNRELFHLVVSNVLLVMRQCLNPEPTCRPDSAYLCRNFGRLVDRLT
ncbi:serine/threonine protein kinase [Plasmodium inui San Antonio 1]|uniref:Serine/threonine protein kinase n=1 Tax=Plasmodium inui San Antonio 1 TaxID=1237626 RepID=W7A9Z8_9APIC|nr:serine/threonine protein kinase [Plasmodium inui San Antonio 1]EUD68083.1 serine/threonine protein kinase [Plasmodium inui San Antonio 1]